MLSRGVDVMCINLPKARGGSLIAPRPSQPDTILGDCRHGATASRGVPAYSRRYHMILFGDRGCEQLAQSRYKVEPVYFPAADSTGRSVK